MWSDDLVDKLLASPHFVARQSQLSSASGWTGEKRCDAVICWKSDKSVFAWSKKFTHLNERRESEHKGKQKEHRGRKSQQEIEDGVELPDGGAFKLFEGLTIHLWKKNLNNQIQVLCRRSKYLYILTILDRREGWPEDTKLLDELLVDHPLLTCCQPLSPFHGFRH